MLDTQRAEIAAVRLSGATLGQVCQVLFLRTILLAAMGLFFGGIDAATVLIALQKTPGASTGPETFTHLVPASAVAGGCMLIVLAVTAVFARFSTADPIAEMIGTRAI